MRTQKKVRTAGTLFVLLLFVLGPVVFGQVAGASDDSATQKKNIDQYITLLRENVRQQRAQITGGVLQLTPDESRKFWPIYEEYQAALTKLNDSRIQNLRTFATNYSQLTDEKTDHLMKEELNLRKQRDELLTHFYERVKKSLGVETAARFLLIESQIELIADLQLDSMLPIGG
jgi:hypothetical protein